MVSEQSLHRSYRYAVCEIDEHREPTRLFGIVEHADWERALEHAFNSARERVHKDGAIATGIFELSPDGSALRRVATAGCSRLSTGSRSAADTLSALVGMAVA
jgi:hypothetical protein